MNPAKQQGISANAPTMATAMMLEWGTGAIGMQKGDGNDEGGDIRGS